VADSPLIVWPVMLAAAAWTAACCWILLEGRRAEWALADAQGASFETTGHGFQVLVPTADAPAPPASNDPSPITLTRDPESHPAPAAPSPGWAGPAGHWELVLLVLVLVGVATYLLQSALFVSRLDRYLSPGFWLKLLGGQPLGPQAYGLVDTTMIWPWMINPRSSDVGARVMIVTAALTGGLALAWVAWGAACAIAGPRLRRPAVVLAASMVGLTIFTTGYNFYELSRLRAERDAGPGAYYGYPPPGSFLPRKPFTLTSANLGRPGFSDLQFIQVTLVRNGLAQAAFPLLLLILLTRPQVGVLFDARPGRPRGRHGA
jgi:hypothetical protein